MITKVRIRPVVKASQSGTAKVIPKLLLYNFISAEQFLPVSSASLRAILDILASKPYMLGKLIIVRFYHCLRI
jgi:hypothetical protein